VFPHSSAAAFQKLTSQTHHLNGCHCCLKSLIPSLDARAIQCLLKYPGEVQVYFGGTFCNARNGAMLEFMGENATLYLDRGRYEIHPERNKKIEKQEYILGTGPRGADFYDKPDGEMLHMVNWVECVRSRARPNAPAEAGVSGASALTRALLRRPSEPVNCIESPPSTRRHPRACPEDPYARHQG